jgi:hypothetical protein
MSWIRVCEFCKERTDIEYKRVAVFNKFAVLNFKNGRYQAEVKSVNNEAVVCEKCAKTHTIKEIWEKMQYHIQPVNSEVGNE